MPFKIYGFGTVIKKKMIYNISAYLTHKLLTVVA